MGIGDLSVPKHMKRVGEAFYGRAQAYQAALAAADDVALVEVLTRNVYSGDVSQAAAAARLAAYMRSVAGALARQPAAALMAGRVDLPDPATVLPTVEQA
jgi:cytochrome b pre-mRNA-processing protein 3